MQRSRVLSHGDDGAASPLDAPVKSSNACRGRGRRAKRRTQMQRAPQRHGIGKHNRQSSQARANEKANWTSLLTAAASGLKRGRRQPDSCVRSGGLEVQYLAEGNLRPPIPPKAGVRMQHSRAPAPPAVATDRVAQRHRSPGARRKLQHADPEFQQHSVWPTRLF